jgi:hypothetical protein
MTTKPESGIMDLVPFQRKERSPDVEAAIEAALAADEAVHAHDDVRRGLLEVRAAAITKAIDEGATWTELAGRFGLSAPRIRQMAKQGDADASA